MFRTLRRFPAALMATALMVLCMLPGLSQAASSGIQQGDWLLRLKVAGLVPTHETSSTTPLGGHLDTPSTILPTLDVSYFLTDHWAVEMSGGTFSSDYRLRDSLLGDLEVGRIKSGSVSLVAQYHFRPDTAIRPWLGIGINHTWPISIDPEEGVPDFEASRLTSPLIDAGLDYPLWGPWFASASMRYVMLPTQRFEGDGFSARSRLNVLVMSAGLGLHF
ncbi:OmpW/AlkL family protein [Kushneria indalinina]|uniref:Outer membrane protein n=1 Tax=Kushneria indalinina DSM 14324 TaxID=1122140 RepID=A0A3D9DZW2_9GAMM|nr:OmpW family outer membrane protein [Kushneria indalinina]REC96317.1 outer membrane protein [Kushneria indalinina DSM 14324]